MQRRDFISGGASQHNRPRSAQRPVLNHTQTNPHIQGFSFAVGEPGQTFHAALRLPRQSLCPTEPTPLAEVHNWFTASDPATQTPPPKQSEYSERDRPSQTAYRFHNSRPQQRLDLLAIISH